MEEEWIKIKEITGVRNLIEYKYVIEYEQEKWKEILEPYKVKYKFGFTEDKAYMDNKATLPVVIYQLNLYTTKEYLQKIKSIINEYESATVETPKELEEDDDEENE